MHNPYRGGTADVWYSGVASDRWIEYKWIDRVPKRARVVPKLEPLQKKWLGDRYKEGRSVYVAVGCPAGIAVFSAPAAWEQGISAAEFNSRLVSRAEFAAQIARAVGGR